MQKVTEKTVVTGQRYRSIIEFKLQIEELNAKHHKELTFQNREHE